MEYKESPISINTRAKSPNGFEYQLTFREGATDESFGELMALVAAKEKILLSKGWEAVKQGSKFPPKAQPNYIPNKLCPLDGGKLIAPQAGSKAPIKCENNKWNAATKQSYGCSFIEWPNPTPIPVRDVNEDGPDFLEY